MSFRGHGVLGRLGFFALLFISMSPALAMSRKKPPPPPDTQIPDTQTPSKSATAGPYEIGVYFMPTWDNGGLWDNDTCDGMTDGTNANLPYDPKTDMMFGHLMAGGTRVWDEGRRYIPENDWHGPFDGSPQTSQNPKNPNDNRKPLLGFYDRKNKSILQKQVQMMKTYGIDYIAFDWYWAPIVDWDTDEYGVGEPQFECPIRNFIAMNDALPKANQIKFAIDYMPDGERSAKGMAITIQNKGKDAAQALYIENMKKMVTQYWVPYFKNENYLKYDGKPVLYFWQDGEIKALEMVGLDLNYFMTSAKKILAENGIPEIVVIGKSNNPGKEDQEWFKGEANLMRSYGFQGSTEYFYHGFKDGSNNYHLNRYIETIPYQKELANLHEGDVLVDKADPNTSTTFIRVVEYKKDAQGNPVKELLVNAVHHNTALFQSYTEMRDSYQRVWDAMISGMQGQPYYYPLPVTPGWDRSPMGGSYYSIGGSEYPAILDHDIGSNPEEFKKMLLAAKATIDKNSNVLTKKGVIICSWNEHTEGTYIEPSEKWQYGFLEKVREVFKPELANLVAPAAPIFAGDSKSNDDSSPVNRVADAIKKGIEVITDEVSKLFGGGTGAPSAPVAAKSGSSVFDLSSGQMGDSDAITASSQGPSPNANAGFDQAPPLREGARTLAQAVVPGKPDPASSHEGSYTSHATIDQKLKCETSFSFLLESTRSWQENFDVSQCQKIRDEVGNFSNSSDCTDVKLRDLSPNLQQKIIGSTFLHASINAETQDLFSRELQHDSKDILDRCPNINSPDPAITPANPVELNPVVPKIEDQQKKRGSAPATMKGINPKSFFS